jgi:beta-galactosidase
MGRSFKAERMEKKLSFLNRRRGSLQTFLLSLLTVASVPEPGLTQIAAGSSLPQRILYLGTAWYPEQWSESRWEADLALMQDAGIRFVRLGEFSWSTLEPEEGQFSFGWLDHAIEAAAHHGIDTVLGTPTAAPPAWLTQKYPETLRVKANGDRDEHGNRQQFNWADKTYRRLARQIVEKMAERYGRNPHVIGWQIDNEYEHISYDSDTRAQFQRWLEARYRTLADLNEAWTTAYWSQTYSDWAQIPIPTQHGNPGLFINWKRFVSDQWRSYQKNQVDVIRAFAAHQFITTNLMGWFDGFDQYTVTQDLDLAAWDDYVADAHLDPVRNGAAQDLTRGFLRRNFWVMETQAGSGSFDKINSTLDKGETRAMAWHAVGHGADAIAFWQWRSSLNGQEQYAGTLVGVDGAPNPLYSEIAQVGHEFAAAGSALADTSVRSTVAIVQSYDSRWAIDWQRHNERFSPVQQILSYYAPLRRFAQSVDILPPTTPLEGYKLVIAPGLNILLTEVAEHLAAYVKNGGHLVLGQRSGMKNSDSELWSERQPGPLSEALGAKVEQYFAIRSPIGINGVWGTGQSELWAEALQVADPEVEVMMRYQESNGWLDGQPAAVTRKVGKGRITYIGAWLDPETMASAVSWMMKTSNVIPQFPSVPDGIEVNVRSGNQKTIYILVNFANEPKTVKLPVDMYDVLGKVRVSSISLRHYDVCVLERKSNE